MAHDVGRKSKIIKKLNAFSNYFFKQQSLLAETMRSSVDHYTVTCHIYSPSTIFVHRGIFSNQNMCMIQRYFP